MKQYLQGLWTMGAVAGVAGSLAGYYGLRDAAQVGFWLALIPLIVVAIYHCINGLGE